MKREIMIDENLSLINLKNMVIRLLEGRTTDSKLQK